MSERLARLKRIAAVQKRMGELAELRVATAERECATLAADQLRLRDYILDQGPLHPTFAGAILRATHAVDKKLVDAGHLRDRQQADRDGLKRREHAVEALVDKTARAVARAREERDLAETMEAWLARGASLP